MGHSESFFFNLTVIANVLKAIERKINGVFQPFHRRDENELFAKFVLAVNPIRVHAHDRSSFSVENAMIRRTRGGGEFRFIFHR